jgi:glyoxylase-like metal-dependent hydrolase (beta-lactamase superfamily II)
MPIPYVREMEFEYGVPQRLSARIRRVVSQNPGPFTYFGTGVYVIGAGDTVVIDPGPEQPGQLEMLTRTLGEDRVRAILLTHAHLDHSPMARPLAEATGATIYAAQPAVLQVITGEEGDDPSFNADAPLTDGEFFRGRDWTLEAIATPGHTASHFCFALAEENALFSGDHVMGWSTSVIGPPDGDMDAYLESLAKIRARNFAVLYPTHGPPIFEATQFLDALIAHRLERETQILAQLSAGKTRIPEIVAVLYAEVDPRVHAAAQLSVLAHMIRLDRAGRIRVEGPPSLSSDYAPA